MKEKWINEITGLEHLTGYKIKNDGTITSYLKRCSGSYGYCVSDLPQCILKPEVARNKTRKKQDGYLKINLRSKQYSIHQLVALAFIPNPENKPEVNHKDGDKLHCHESNLEWVTHSENLKHAIRLGLLSIPKGNNHYSKQIIDKHHASRKIIQFNLNGEILNYYPSIKQASITLNIERSRISGCLIGREKSCFGFKFEYQSPS